ncbi:hypothetical protein FPV67DRAFT_1449711 [Lyophyllum atratum]|nr:hypothetical protein FPV67DRAFT_1449711 [Lyophyllum atratum]
MSPTSRLLRFRSAAHLLSVSSTKKTKHFLKTSAEPILRAFRIPHAEHAEFPRGKPTILNWANTLIAHYASHDDAEVSDLHRRRMGTLTVKELRWYQSATGVEHNYVIAIIADPQHGCERFIRLDRARDDPGMDVVVSFPGAPHRQYARSAESFSSSQSSLSFYDEPIDGAGTGCLDAMWVLGALPEADRLIERSTFRGSQGNYGAPTLLDLALVARAVHDNNNYHLWPRQCVWFSTMIVRGLQADFRHHITHRDSSLTFQNWMIEVLDSEGVQGTFKAKAVYKEQERVVGDVVMAYRASRDDVVARIEEAATRVTRHKEQHQIIDEAVAQRDEAAAIAAAAAASSVEATARAAEAAARAADAEERAEREARLREEAEERAHDEARKNAMSERELRDLRRRLEELEKSSRSRERRRRH